MLLDQKTESSNSNNLTVTREIFKWKNRLEIIIIIIFKIKIQDSNKANCDKK
jgi:hypothetical protein